MISDGTYEEFECAYSTDKHFVQEPITLTCCGQSVCKNCLVNASATLKCVFCNAPVDNSLKTATVSATIKKSIRRHLEDLFVILERQTDKALNQLESDLATADDAIESHIASVKTQIDIRLQSMKSELDTLHEKLNNRLEEIEQTWKRDKKDRLAPSGANVSTFKETLEKLKVDVEEKANENEEKLYQYQLNLQNINKLISYINEETYKLSFASAVDRINDTLIGKIEFIPVTKKIRTTISVDTLERTLDSCNLEKVVDLKFKPSDLCILPNGLLGMTNYEQYGYITVYGNNFNIVSMVDQIDGKPIQPFGIATNGEDRIYITELITHSVIMTDLQFRLIKSFGTKGTTEVNEFTYPFGLSYSYNNLYVCDAMNKRLVKLSPNLEFVEAFKVDYYPWIVKVLGNTICIKTGDTNELNFYEASSFQIKAKYALDKGRIGLIDNGFYELNVEKKKVNVFNEDGNLTRSLDLKDPIKNYFSIGWDGCIGYFCNTLLISSNSLSKVLALSV